MTAEHLTLAPSPTEPGVAPSLLDAIIEQSKVAANEAEKDHTKDLIAELVDQVCWRRPKTDQQTG